MSPEKEIGLPNGIDGVESSKTDMNAGETEFDLAIHYWFYKASSSQKQAVSLLFSRYRFYSFERSYYPSGNSHSMMQSSNILQVQEVPFESMQLESNAMAKDQNKELKYFRFQLDGFGYCEVAARDFACIDARYEKVWGV